MLRAANEETGLVAYAPTLLVADALFAAEKCPRERLRFLELIGSVVVAVLPTTRDIYEPIVCHLGIPGGIVKHPPARSALRRAAFSSFFLCFFRCRA